MLNKTMCIFDGTYYNFEACYEEHTSIHIWNLCKHSGDAMSFMVVGAFLTHLTAETIDRR